MQKNSNFKLFYYFKMKNNRRQFLQKSLATGAVFSLANHFTNAQTPKVDPVFSEGINNRMMYGQALDLSPAKWIWFPGGRTLPNSFFFFRKKFKVTKKLKVAMLWILGESRYKLHINGRRKAWGPAPYDPRWAEADPVIITDSLSIGTNYLASEVLYYGHGDGTWPIGKPGFICQINLYYEDGTSEQINSDNTWETAIAKAWKPGKYKRWYLRALQEEFDNRMYPANWKTFEEEKNSITWYKAREIAGSSGNKPVVSSWSPDYLYDSGGAEIPGAELRKRSIPMVKETAKLANRISEFAILEWKTAPEDFFDFTMTEADCFTVKKYEHLANDFASNEVYSFEAKTNESYAVTFTFDEQGIGFPFFEITCSEGTIVELMVHEGHQPYGTHTLLNTHFNSWTRFICKQGVNQLECFDYESFRWVQLHIHNAKGTVKLKDIGMKRRQYPFENKVNFHSNDVTLLTLMKACENTVYNNSIETIVDGMARERQQYSGDLGHMVHALVRHFGDTHLWTRFINTYSQGLTKSGYFLDTWPAYDRLARLMEREVNLTNWGPLLDHGVGFNFDCYHFYMYTGDTSALKEVYPRLKTFFNYLKKSVAGDGLLPVENLGIPTVWIDHEAYQQQKHKKCAFNLYVSAMALNALSPLATAVKDDAFAKEVTNWGQNLLQKIQAVYWDDSSQAFVVNKPWFNNEKGKRYCDKSLAMAIMYDLNPNKNNQKSYEILKNRPSEMGRSYVTNAFWRYWALGKMGDVTEHLKEFRNEWINMPSVNLNNTMAEWMNVKPDCNHQWSHAAIAPMVAMHMDFAGITPTSPGFTNYEIKPNFGDLKEFKIGCGTPYGEIMIEVNFYRDDKLTINAPRGTTGKVFYKNKWTTIYGGKTVI